MNQTGIEEEDRITETTSVKEGKLYKIIAILVMFKFKFRSFIVRYTDQHRIRLGTEILRTRQCKATWHNVTCKYSEQVYTYDKITCNTINLQNIQNNKQ